MQGEFRPIVLNEEINQSALDQLQRQLGLARTGRLSDSEDVCFGSRRLYDGPAGIVWLQLLRLNDDPDLPYYSYGHWQFKITYTSQRPPPAISNLWRADILAAIEKAGLSVHEA